MRHAARSAHQSSKRVLILAKSFPFPLDQGGKLRVYHLIRELAQSHQITLVCYSRSAEDVHYLAELSPWCEDIHLVPCYRRVPTKIADVVRAFFSGLPYTVVANTSSAMRTTLRTVLRQNNFDLLQVEEVYLTRNVEGIRGTLPMVLSTFNIEALVLKRLSEHQKSWWKRSLYYREARRMSRFELGALTKFDALVTVSENESTYFSQYHPLCVLAPNGVAATVDSSTIRRKSQILFTGALEYPPNAQGLEFFLRNVWPQVAAVLPEAQLAIVAKHPGKRLQQFANKRIRFHTSVADMQPYFLESSALVVPLLAGGGTRIKILEAFAHRLPVVSTRIGVEGIAASDPEHLLIRDNADSMAGALIEVLQSPANAAQRAENAMHLVETRYLWKTSAAVYLSVYDRLWQQAEQ